MTILIYFLIIIVFFYKNKFLVFIRAFAYFRRNFAFILFINLLLESVNVLKE